MIKEFNCRWPQGIERMRIGPGFSDCAGRQSISLSMRCGLGVGGSVHLYAEDAVGVAQALAVEWYELVRHREARYPCTFFRGVDVLAERDVDEGGAESVSVRFGDGLAYLSNDDAKALAMDLLRMAADVEG